jgi:hypothetical protein
MKRSPYGNGVVIITDLIIIKQVQKKIPRVLPIVTILMSPMLLKESFAAALFYVVINIVFVIKQAAGARVK